MNIKEIRNIVNDKLHKRDYYAIYLFINELSEEYLQSDKNNYELCIELITQNQNLWEYMGASKQFESDFELNNTIMRNRNKLFLSCLNENQKELRILFKRAVGDFSTEY